jgi:hypothetical protein
VAQLEHRQIIIREIEKWRKSKLLPEQYCDFLLNLYRNEDEHAGFARQGSKRIYVQIRPLLALIGISGLLLTIYVLVSFYFSVLSQQMQLGLTCIWIITLYTAGFFMHKRRQLISSLVFGAGSLLILLSGPDLIQLLGIASPYAIFGYILVVSLIWVALGLLFRISFLQLCGWAGLLLVYGWWLETSFEPLSLWQAQILWLVVTLLFAGCGWRFHRRFPSWSRILLLIALITVFVPEVHLILNGFFGGGQFFMWFLGKALVLAVSLWLSRKRWMEWMT